MRTIVAILAVGFLLTASGCSTTGYARYKYDYNPQADFVALHTFGWAEKTQPQTGNAVSDNPLSDQRIRDSIEDRLNKKGYVKTTDGNPDFLLRYVITVTDKTDVQVVDYYYGSPTPLWYRGLPAPLSTRTVTYTYQEGTLIIDVVEAKSGNLIWRGSAEAEINHSQTPEQERAKIDRITEKLFSRFPPK